MPNGLTDLPGVSSWASKRRVSAPPLAKVVEDEPDRSCLGPVIRLAERSPSSAMDAAEISMVPALAPETRADSWKDPSGESGDKNLFVTPHFVDDEEVMPLRIEP